MSEPLENPRAFPIHAYAMDQTRWNDGQEGMSLRDYFAAKALQGLLSNPNLKNESDDTLEVALAKSSYDLADAMLERRSSHEP